MSPTGPLWTCPKCGHRFVTRNLWHSCGRYPLAAHFAGKNPEVRRLFDRFSAMVRSFGPVTIYAQKTRIVCQVRVRFAGAVPRKRWLNLSLWLPRPVDHPALVRTDKIAPRCYSHTFRITSLADFDSDFHHVVRQAYAVGCQDHLTRVQPVRPPRKAPRRVRRSR